MIEIKQCQMVNRQGKSRYISNGTFNLVLFYRSINAKSYFI